MTYPIVIKNALPRENFIKLGQYLQEGGWHYRNTDQSYPGAPVSWSQSETNSLSFIENGSYLLYKVKKFLKRNIRLVKVHVNGQTVSQVSNFHTDTKLPDVWTLVLFTRLDWNTNFGGEFTLYDPYNLEYKSVSYIPNTAVLFPSNWQHRGACPLVPEAGLRTSIAFLYCELDTLGEFWKTNKNLQQKFY